MTTKALFFDIDGTLVSFNTHEIPASAVDALEQAKANGLKVFIATGRPRQLINNLSAISHLIDGYVTTNGAYCYAGDNNIVCNPIPEADALSIKAEADRMGAMSLVVGIDGILLCNPDIPLVDGLQKLLNVPSIPVGNDITPLLRHGIVQMTVFVSASQEPRLPLVSDFHRHHIVQSRQSKRNSSHGSPFRHLHQRDDGIRRRRQRHPYAAPCRHRSGYGQRPPRCAGCSRFCHHRSRQRRHRPRPASFRIDLAKKVQQSYCNIEIYAYLCSRLLLT